MIPQRGIITVPEGDLYLETQPGWFSDGVEEFELRNTDLHCRMIDDIDAVISAERLYPIRKRIKEMYA